MRIGFLQMQPRFGRPEENVARIGRALARARDATIVLPELCTTGYVFHSRAELESLAESVDGPSVTALGRLARRNRLTLCAGIAERDGSRIYNAAATILPSGRVHVYRKAHLFDREKLVFDVAPARFEPQPGAGRFGVMICFDWVFPEVCRSLALRGARVILHPSNLVLPWCQQAMVTRAIENRVFTVTCNRVGVEARGGVALRFTGRSQIVDPRGKVLLRAPAHGEMLRILDLDVRAASRKQLTRRNDLFRDRRPELYSALVEPRA
jgi:predicted amidohydrolase